MSYFDFIAEYLPKLLQGAVNTVLVMLCSALFAIVTSVIFGLLRLSPSRLARGLATIYIEFFCGTSLLVQLYWIYYVLPLLGVSFTAFTSGVLALGPKFSAARCNRCPNPNGRRRWRSICRPGNACAGSSYRKPTRPCCRQRQT